MARMSRPLGAVLCYRDATLIADVPYDGDPTSVEPMPTARAALDALREHGIRTGAVVNQTSTRHRWLNPNDMATVNAKVERLLGPFDVWRPCPPDDPDQASRGGSGAEVIRAAAEALTVRPETLVVIGSGGADVAAAHAAGARAVLVPTQSTRPEEAAAAPDVAPDLFTAVHRLLEPSLAHAGQLCG
jgi:D-glycero-D-manno-heptose 1,7-bisphosphate phosphatase